MLKNLKLFSYSSCSTCRKAIKWLRSNGIDFELIDILNTPPSKEMLISASKQYGDRKYLLNTSGLIYRSIGSKIVKEMSDNEFFEKLVMEPRLIKRPFLLNSNKFFLVGFKEEKWAEELL
tara:strand:+ start:191 stop:550 length:360 start_codon:yes stop_codon:yes gene_type:complete